ncbi:MAG: DNA polymerase III subunit gamma/tau [Alphaproteobacteria bacterium]|nr:DNA polymerase III subunit gamma/tau [Alphaproteobacteria bacterium]
MTDEPALGLDLPQTADDRGAYRVLARKYRPQTFDSLIGQDAMVRTLGNAFLSRRIAHAFMLTGVSGVGKTKTARIVARALNCVGPYCKRTEPTITPCGVCNTCIAIAESRHPDVFEMDAASRTGIDDIREIIDGTRYLPAEARYKVYIIDEVHMLSKNAFNGLLKTLEEPPPHVKFIFATTEIRKVPVTVLSRCQRFDLRRIPAETLIAHIRSVASEEGFDVPDEALAIVARAAEGSVRDALSILDQALALAEDGAAPTAESVRAMLGLADRARVLDLYDLTMKGDVAGAIGELRSQYDSGADPIAVLQDMLELTHWLTRLKIVPDASKDASASPAERDQGLAMAQRLSMQTLTRTWTLLLKSLVETRDAPLAIQAAEMAIARLCFAADLPPLDRLVADAESRGPAAAPPAGAAGRAPSGPAPRAEARATAVRAEPRAQPADQPAAAAVPSFEALLKKLEDEDHLILKSKIERSVRLISFAQGHIALAFEPNAPQQEIVTGLQQNLKRWTDGFWKIEVRQAGGAEPIQKTREDAKAQVFAEVAAHPLVKAALETFPGAKIVEVIDPEIVDAPDIEEGSDE